MQRKKKKDFYFVCQHGKLHSKSLRGVDAMSSMEATMSMLETMPEEARLKDLIWRMR